MIDITKPTDNTIGIRYQSPIRFFEQYNIDYNLISTIDYFTLEVQRVYSLQNSATIKIEDIVYTEDKLIAELQHPQFKDRLAHHITIWNKKGLLKYLEQDIIQLREASRYWHSLANNPEFVTFVSPYFVLPYQKAMDKWLNSPAFDSASRWLTYLNFMTTADRQKALSTVCDFMEKNTDFFNRITFTDSKLDSLRPWTEQNWYLFMNALPSSIYEYRNNLAAAILSFVKKICQTDLDTAFLIVLRLSKVEYLDQQIGMEVHKYHLPLSEAYYKKLEIERGYNEEEEETDNSFFGSVKSIFAIISLIISLVSMVAKCS